jgi:hypothetical protein
VDEHDLNRLFLRGVWASAIPSDDDLSYGTFDDDPGEIEWGLFELDVNTGEPIRPMLGLHEDILGLDPSGNEMRPPTDQP